VKMWIVESNTVALFFVGVPCIDIIADTPWTFCLLGISQGRHCHRLIYCCCQ